MAMLAMLLYFSDFFISYFPGGRCGVEAVKLY
jgi:hypothetical protein